MAQTQIQTEFITDNAVTTAKIAANAVTSAKLATNAVTTTAITDANVTPAKLSQPLTQGTAQNSTSGTSIDFTGIPSWVKRVTIVLNGVSTNGTSSLLVQIGTGGTPTTTGYTSASAFAQISASATGGASSTAGFVIYQNTAAMTTNGTLGIFNVSGNTWVASGVTTNAVIGAINNGNVTLSGVLNMVRITTTNGTDAFDAGSINILYE